MNLSASQIIELTLKPGAVYKYEDKTALGTDVPHYFIVINNYPKDEPILLLTCISSKVKEARERALRRGQAPETFVELNSSEFEFLTLNSIVDCNNIFIKSKTDLIRKCESGILVTSELNPQKLEELQAAFLASKKHSISLKRIINPSL